MKNFNQRNRDDKRNFGSRSMYPAVCDKCGQACEVPFKPSGDKPVYCNDCFDKNKSSVSDRPGGRNVGRPNYSNKQMYSAVCAKCGKKCEVPFKPSGDKPVYCNDCFSQNRGNEYKNSQPSFQHAKDQFAIINAKLDKILFALSPKQEKQINSVINKLITSPSEKKVIAKNLIKKKVVAVSGKTKKKKK